ncbi:MAG: ABC transporter ATP-binding protein [Pseudomonadota bacterium]
MATDALRLHGVDAAWGDSRVLEQVSFTLAEGRVLGLLGRNGAGKSTCLSVVAGLLAPRAGTVTLFGQAIGGRAPEAIAAAGLALVPQGRRIFKSLSVRENLVVAARAPRYAMRKTWDLDAVYLAFPRLRERQHQVAGSLSGGEQQMLAIARALMTNPRVLLMDEPSEGLAPQIVAEVMATVRSLKQQGLTLVLVEQNADAVLALADDIVVLNTGQVVLAGTSEDIARGRAELHRHLGVF